MPSAVRQFPVVVLVTALVLALMVPGAMAQQAGSLEIRPADTSKETVKADDMVIVEGSAGQGPVTAVRLLGTRADGSTFFYSDFPPGTVQGGSDRFEYVRRDDDGSVTGQVVLPCEFNWDNLKANRPGCSPVEVWRAQLEIQVGGETLRSNVLRVDALRPEIRQYELLTPTRIRAVFTEPVRIKDGNSDGGPDSPGDWQVSGPDRVVTRVENPPAADCVYPPGEDPQKGEHDCSRILTIEPPVDGDANPTVLYEPSFGRTAYEDYSKNQVVRGENLGPTNNPSEAIDRVRPPIPSIDEIAGDEPDETDEDDPRLHGNDPAPQVRVGNVTEGHDVTVTAKRPDGTAVSETVTVAGPGTVPSLDDGTVTVSLPPIGPDAAYSIGAVAVDPSGNRSDDQSKGPASADSGPNPVTYILDTVAPRAVAAALQTRRQILVIFNEPVSPDGDAGRWTVDGQEATAEGSGDRRRLTTSNDINGPGLVEWRPESIGPLTSRYTDGAGNELETVSIPAVALPAIVGPKVVRPDAETYTRASSQVIAGTAGEDNAVDLLERTTGARLGSTQAADGTWSFTQALPADGRYRFDVRSRDESTGSSSARVPAPDIVRDTVAPVVSVLSPAPEPSATQPDGRPRRGIGGTVTVEWLGTDPAPTDPQRPDHGAGVDIDIVFGDNTVRPIARNETHAPGQPRSFSYEITQEDLAGHGTREARFRVTLRDLAGNATSATSAPIVIVGDLLDYGAFLVERGIIEARFPVTLTGETSGAEWLVDGKPAQTATREQRDGRSVIRITDATVRDPNATPTIRYQPAPANPSPLRGSRGAEISTALRLVVDRVAPELAITRRDTQGVVVDADRVRFAGTTDDDTTRPNMVHAFILSDAGDLPSSPAASTQADAEGEWTLDVPLRPDHRNRMVIQAVDPSSNVSAALPQPPALVIEDSTPPVIDITAPAFGAPITETVPLRWSLVEANLLYLVVDYRVDGGQWQRLQQMFSNEGGYTFNVPDAIKDKTLGFRVTATDKIGKTDDAVVDGLHVAPAAPPAGPELVRARATGAQVVDVTFSEPVTVDGSGFLVDGATVRRVKGDGLTRTFILDRAVTTTTPTVEYSGTTVTNDAGIEMEPTSVRARRSFAFAVTDLRGQRVTPNRVRVAWADTRNRSDDLRGYRIYRDGSPIALVGSATRAFTDARGSGRHVYSVRAVDDRRRVSSVRRVTVR